MPDKRKPTVFGTGTMGSGPYTRTNAGRAYRAWLSMLERCCNTRSTRYDACSRVCPEWLDFQVFAAWYEQHEYDCPSRLRMVRLLGREYGPDACVLVPVELLPAIPTEARPHRGLPGGVGRAAGRRYQAAATYHGTIIRREPRDTPEEARADYLEIRASILDDETARLDAVLTDGIRAMAAVRAARMREEADGLRRHARPVE